jgi:hypothetical protein
VRQSELFASSEAELTSERLLILISPPVPLPRGRHSGDRSQFDRYPPLSVAMQGWMRQSARLFNTRHYLEIFLSRKRRSGVDEAPKCNVGKTSVSVKKKVDLSRRVNLTDLRGCGYEG